MKNSFLTHGDWSSLCSEPSKSGSSSFHFALTNSLQTSSRWFALFLGFRTFLTEQSSKLTEKLKNSAPNMFLVVNEPEEQEFSLEESKFQHILESGWRSHRIFSSFQIFLAGQQSELTKKIENSTPNIFLVVFLTLLVFLDVEKTFR
jgi:hypothetical protein